MSLAYMQAIDARALLAEFSIGESFLAMARRLSRDELRARQECMFLSCVARAWTTPFYQRLWGAQGIAPGDIRGLDDLSALPTFDKSDIMDSIQRAPPLGDFHGRDSYSAGLRPPVILHTTSGTTGSPQVLLFGPRGREVQNLMLARIYVLQGLRADDVVHSVYGHGMINGGHYVREAVTHWTQAIFLSAGTGIETRSVAQVEQMRNLGATVLVGFADYIKKLAEVAREQGLEPGRDIRVRMVSGHIGQGDRDEISELWGGAQVYDWYGVGDTGLIAGEGPDQDGLYVMEDAHLLEIADIETGAPLADGETGDMVVTVLFKDDIYPMIRFNTHDVSRFRTDRSSIGLNLRRIEGFLGRSDNMIKLRGINIFPHAVGPMLAEIPGFAGEFLCRAERDPAGRDGLVVLAEFRGELPNLDLEASAVALLRRRLGIEVAVVPSPPGSLAHLTGLETRQKPIRLIDNRKAQRS
jgi:phenylacetate-CoA ligase